MKKERVVIYAVIETKQTAGIAGAEGAPVLMVPVGFLGTQAAAQLAKLAPAKAETRLTWKSSKPKIASVTASGLVKALAPGKAKITVKTSNGRKSTIVITVKKAK